MSSTMSKSEALKNFQSSSTEWKQVVSKKNYKSERAESYNTKNESSGFATGYKSVNNTSVPAPVPLEGSIGSKLQSFKNYQDKRRNGEQIEDTTFVNLNSRFGRNLTALHQIQKEQNEKKERWEMMQQYMYKRPTDTIKSSTVSESANIVQAEFPTLNQTKSTTEIKGVWSKTSNLVNSLQEASNYGVKFLSKNSGQKKTNTDSNIRTEIYVCTNIEQIVSDLLVNVPLQTDEDPITIDNTDGFVTVAKHRRKKNVF